MYNSAHHFIEEKSTRTKLSNEFERGIDYSALYRDEVSRNKLKLVLINQYLPVSIDEYFALFIDDQAPHSYAR